MSKLIIDIEKNCLLYSVKEVMFPQYLSEDISNLLGSSSKSMIFYAMNVVVTNFTLLVTTTSPTNVYGTMDYT